MHFTVVFMHSDQLLSMLCAWQIVIDSAQFSAADLVLLAHHCMSNTIDYMQ